LTSTANWSTKPFSNRVATTSGRIPLVSSLMGRPNSRRSRRKSARPGAMVGSPPVTVTPSSHFLRSARNTLALYAGVWGSSSMDQANSKLWQVGHRRLQPPKKSTVQTLPGQSQRLMGSTPRKWDQAPAGWAADSGAETVGRRKAFQSRSGDGCMLPSLSLAVIVYDGCAGARRQVLQRPNACGPMGEQTPSDVLQAKRFVQGAFLHYMSLFLVKRD